MLMRNYHGFLNKMEQTRTEKSILASIKIRNDKYEIDIAALLVREKEHRLQAS